MSSKIIAKIEDFLKDSELQERFNDAVRRAPLKLVIWPENGADFFGAEFKVSNRNLSCPYPMWDHEHRIGYIGKKIDALCHEESNELIHPSIAYYYLSIYQQTFRPPPRSVPSRGKKKISGKSKTLTAEKKLYEQALLRLDRKLYNRIQKIKNKLKVTVEMKRAKTREDMHEAIINELQNLTGLYCEEHELYKTLVAEIEAYRNPDHMHPEVRKTMDEIIAENASQKIIINREKLKIKTLEREVNHLMEQVLTAPVREMPSEEVETLRNEYIGLSEKYDLIVSKNIELANRLEKVRKARALEDILDVIRDNINSILRANINQTDDSLLKNIQSEIEQLKRARVYLGRALYDIGLLHLRLGRKKKAIEEFRAARELGIEDPETNKLLNHQSGRFP